MGLSRTAGGLSRTVLYCLELQVEVCEGSVEMQLSCSELQVKVYVGSLEMQMGYSELQVEV
jgi:hypothetical protein